MNQIKDESVHIYTDKVTFFYDISSGATTEYSLHCHNHYEVYFFLEGDVSYLVEGKQYTPSPGSILLLAPHVFHGVKVNSNKTYRRFSLHFNPDVLTLERRAFLLSVFPSSKKQAEGKIYFENVERFQLFTYFNTLKNYATKDETTKEQLFPIGIEAILAQLVYMYHLESPTPGDSSSDTITKIIWYLNKHLKEDISLDDLSNRFFISKHHLNKVFRKATGTTVFDYLIHKRVIAAQQLLINGASAQVAAAESGFTDYSSFYRSYTRILGHSPIRDKGAIPSLALFEDQHVAFLQLEKT
ncbi:MAG: helix-turn-helix domain-containing protein [Lachnospiraceae bacterium]|nr:helix-turn-helix domain-containing protein [Lachnospiraceae bacterium]